MIPKVPQGQGNERALAVTRRIRAESYDDGIALSDREQEGSCIRQDVEGPTVRQDRVVIVGMRPDPELRGDLSPGRVVSIVDVHFGVFGERPSGTTACCIALVRREG